MLCRFVVSLGNVAGEHQRPHTIVNRHQVTRSHLHGSKTVFHRLEARVATCHQLVRDVEIVLATQFLPQPELVRRQHHNELVAHGREQKSRHGAHEHRDATQLHKLLGHGSPESGSATPCHYQRCPFHISLIILNYKYTKLFPHTLQSP